MDTNCAIKATDHQLARLIYAITPAGFIGALDSLGTPWREVSSLSHLPGVMHTVRHGTALTVLPASVVSPSWRILAVSVYRNFRSSTLPC
jgi:hypothetical protein